MDNKRPIQPFKKPTQARQSAKSRQEPQYRYKFPDKVNGKGPDEMTPEEFEEFLGL